MTKTSPRRQPLSPQEHDVMAVVWARGEVVADDVAAALGGRLKNATVRTILRRVEGKGYLTHRRDGRAYVYTPRLDADAAARGAVRRVMDRFYGGSVERLLVGLLDGRMIDGEQLEELQRRLKEVDNPAVVAERHSAKRGRR